MPEERLSMRKTRDILRLKYENGFSHRAISRSCQVGLGTVNECVGRAKRARVSWPLPPELSDEDLENALYPKPATVETRDSSVPNWATVVKELGHKGVTRFLLWEEYQRDHPNGLRYSRYCELL